MENSKEKSNEANFEVEYEYIPEDESFPEDLPEEENAEVGGFLSKMSSDTTSFTVPVITFGKPKSVVEQSEKISPPENIKDLDLSAFTGTMSLNEALSEKFDAREEIETKPTSKPELDFEAQLAAAVQGSSEVPVETPIADETPNIAVVTDKVDTSETAVHSTIEQAVNYDHGEIIARSILWMSDSTETISEKFYNKTLRDLEKMLTDDSSDKAAIQSEIEGRITAMKSQLAEEEKNFTAEEKENIVIATPTITRRHGEALQKKFFKSVKNAQDSQGLRKVLQNLATFGAWLKANSISMVGKFFSSRSKGYAMGKSEKARPTFSLAHMLGVAAVGVTVGVTAHEPISDAVDRTTTYAQVQYENIRNVDFNNYVQLASDYADSSMDFVNTKVSELNPWRISDASYTDNVDAVSSVMPSANFINKSYEHLEEVYGNSATSNEIMGAVLRDFANLSNVCQENQTPLCKITVNPVATNIINTGSAHSPQANSIVLDAYNGVFEIYDNSGSVSFSEEVNTNNERKLNWF